MFYGWEDFRRGSGGCSEPLIGDAMELQRQIKVMTDEAQRKDDILAKLERDLEIMTAALRDEKSKHAETKARNKDLERELEQRIKVEQGLVKQLEDQDDKHDKAMAAVKNWYESETKRLLALVETLSDAEERLCSQLADLEAEAIDRYGSQSRNTSTQDKFEERKIPLKELEAIDLAAEVWKSTQECDKLNLRTVSLHEEIETLKIEASAVQQELALAKVVNSWHAKETSLVPEGKLRVLRPQKLCRSESLRVGTMPRRQQCGAV